MGAPACTNMNAKRRAQHVVVRPKRVRVKVCKMKKGVWCPGKWHTNYDKGHGWGKARCCKYVNRRRRAQHVVIRKPKVRVRARVKVCKMKKGVWCPGKWHTNYDKGHGWGKARCCKYVNRVRRTQAIHHRIRVRKPKPHR